MEQRNEKGDVSGHQDSTVRLPVLPSSGKAEELRRQMEADRSAAAAASAAAGGIDVAAPVPAPVAPDATSAGAATAPDAPPKSIQQKLLEGKVIEVLRQVYDPEIPVNIYDLGLIYEVDARPDNTVKVRMTLTAPACPVAGTLPGEVERRIETVPDVTSAEVELVWDPPWTRDRMSEVAQLTLGMF